ncbi:hypothetical protein MMSYN1_0928 [synthetic Mycoplasma mycoides JCVI-syn1.0]|nr:hypothetical protein MMSYN1_0928 [synthetic Mycoplasma mycoides JCVI-syn1.0]
MISQLSNGTGIILVTATKLSPTNVDEFSLSTESSISRTVLGKLFINEKLSPVQRTVYAKTKLFISKSVDLSLSRKSIVSSTTELSRCFRLQNVKLFAVISLVNAVSMNSIVLSLMFKHDDVWNSVKLSRSRNDVSVSLSLVSIGISSGLSSWIISLVISITICTAIEI